MGLETTVNKGDAGYLIRHNQSGVVTALRNTFFVEFVRSESVTVMDEILSSADGRSFRAFTEAFWGNTSIEVIDGGCGTLVQIQITHKCRKMKRDLISGLSSAAISLSLRSSGLEFIQESLVSDDDLVAVIPVDLGKGASSVTMMMVSGARLGRHHWFFELIENSRPALVSSLLEEMT